MHWVGQHTQARMEIKTTFDVWMLRPFLPKMHISQHQIPKCEWKHNELHINVCDHQLQEQQIVLCQYPNNE